MAAFPPSAQMRRPSRPRIRLGGWDRLDVHSRDRVRLVLAAFALAAAWVCLTGSPSARAHPQLAGTDVRCAPGNVVAYARGLVIMRDQWICGDVDAYGGGITILGRVTGSVTAFGGGVRVAGPVEGDVTAFGGDIWLLRGASVTGDVQTWGGAIHRTPAALVTGDIERGDRLAIMAQSRWPGFSGHWAFPWPWMLAWAVLAALVVAVAPERTLRVSAVARRAAWRSLAVGVLTILLGATLAAVLFATCIGIPVSLLLLAVLLLAWILGTVALGVWLGEHVVRAIAPNEHSPVLAAIVGAAVLAGIETIPWVGGGVSVIAGSVALGAALLGRFGSQRAPAGRALAASREL